MVNEKLRRVLGLLKFFGVISLATGWITITLSIALNPWFSFSKNALSDLGAIGVRFAYVFNTGLLVAGVFALLYAFFLLSSYDGRLAALASSLFLFSAVHLVLIALFPEGTYPHLFVSYEFFVSSGVAVLVFGSAFLAQRKTRLGIFFAVLSLVGFFLAAVVPWPSISVLEVFAITLLTVWAALMLRDHLES